MVRAGIDGDLFKSFFHFAGERVDFADPFDFVAKKFDAVGDVLFISGHDFQNISARAEGRAHQDQNRCACNAAARDGAGCRRAALLAQLLG